MTDRHDVRHETMLARRRALMLGALAAYRETGNLAESARRAGCTPRAIQSWKAKSRDTAEDDPAWLVDVDGEDAPVPFWRAWQDAFDDWFESVAVPKMVDRGINGHEVEVRYQGQVVGTERRFEPVTSIYVMRALGGRARRPEWSQDTTHVNQQVSGTVQIESARVRLGEKLLAAIERRALAAADEASNVIDVTPERAALPATKEEEE